MANPLSQQAVEAQMKAKFGYTQGPNGTVLDANGQPVDPKLVQQALNQVIGGQAQEAAKPTGLMTSTNPLLVKLGGAALGAGVGGLAGSLLGGSGGGSPSPAAMTDAPSGGQAQSDVANAGNTDPSTASKTGDPTETSNPLGGLGGALKGLVTDKSGSFDWSKLLGLGAAGASAYGNYEQGKNAQNFINQNMQMRKDALSAANADYAARAPLRNAAISKLGTLTQQGPATKGVYSPYLPNATS